MAAVAAASAELLIIGWYIFRVLLQTLSPVRPRPAGNKDSGVRRSPAADDRDQRGKKHPLYSTPGGRRGTCVFLECCIYWVGFAFRNPPGTQPIARSVQVLPAEAGEHGVPDWAARAGGAQAGPQLRPQIPALGGRVIRCSCASRPAWEPVPRRNGGSPVLPRQRSTCQGQ
ncbi:hypothetical protein A6R68_05518 [Neotoma lepida]|uniref:Neuronatin n=1 Tax=Neotoma lepida TaxID=56216 RepID=A0A1A6GKT0_NEOLE|nr:hypothetical protein A6R68_05518 [Neotoma lepida]